MTAFRRVDKGNFHWYQEGQRRVPGVTSVISGGIPKPALIGWAAGAVAEYVADNPQQIAAMGDQREALVGMLKGVPNDDRDRAARRGTEVHRLAEGLVRGLEVDVPEELAGHVESYLRFLEDWAPSDEIVEGHCFNRTLWYAGTFDLIATMGRTRWLLDIKTTRSGVYPEAAIQLAAYRRAEVYIGADGAVHAMPSVDRCGVVWVRADGYDVIPVATGEAVFRAFRWAYGIAEFMRAAKDRPTDYVDAPIYPPRPHLEVVS
jgi:hypothetical protein